MYQPTTRVLTVLELLQAKPNISGRELATRLEVDARTVRRYIVMLQDMGIPVQAEIGRRGGYSLRPGFKLPPLMFTDEEVTAVTLGLLMAKKLGLDAATPTVEGALAKIERVLPLTLRKQVEAIQAVLEFSVQASDTTIESSILSKLSLAVQQNCAVRLSYGTDKARQTERKFDPYGVVYYNARWYTVGYCHLRESLRVFRLDRIQYAELTTQKFVPPENFNCLEYLNQSIANMPDNWEIEVLLLTTLEKVKSKIPPMLATVVQEPKGVVFRAAVNELDWLARFLINLGYRFKVLRPVELQTTLQNLALEIMEIAQS